MKNIKKALLLIPAVTLLASCSIIGDIISGVAGGSFDFGDVIPGDSENGGGDNGGGQTDGDKNTDTLKSTSEITAALGNTYNISLEMVATATNGETENLKYVEAKNEEYLFMNMGEDGEDSKVLYNISSTTPLMYYYSEDDEAYSSATQSSDGATTSVLLSFVAPATGSISYDSKKSVTFLGRACTEYTVETNVDVITAAGSSTSKYTIDNEIGICLKMEQTTAIKTEDGNTSTSTTVEVKEFSQDSSKVKQALKAETDLITIKDWDTSLFTKTGLKGSNIAKPAGEWQYGAIGEYDYVVMYTLSSKTFAEAKTVLDAVSNSFFSAGANMNSDYEKVSSISAQDYESSAEEESALYKGYWSSSEGYFEVNVGVERDYDDSFCLTVKIYL